MFFVTDVGSVSHGIQLAVAPVFLLTAVASMIGTVVGRLGRIIDRSRVLEAHIEATPHDNPKPAILAELKHLRTRSRLVNISIALLTLCAIQIGLTIMALFLGETTAIEIFKTATILFLSGVASFLLALLCFLAETFIATQHLKFSHGGRQALH